MTSSLAQNLPIAIRREAVSRLRIRGLSVRDISIALAQLKPNPIVSKSGKPIGKTTIHTDIQAIEEGWREAAQQHADVFMSRQLATLYEVERSAWAKQDHKLVLETHDRIAKLLGLNAPTEIRTEQHFTRDPHALSDDQIMQIIDHFDAQPKQIACEELPAPGGNGSNGNGHNGTPATYPDLQAGLGETPHAAPSGEDEPA